MTHPSRNLASRAQFVAPLVALVLSVPGAVRADVGSAADGAHGCSTSTVFGWGLDAQLARAESCMYPDALVPVSAGSGLSFASASLRYATPETRSALYSARGHVSFRVNSAFRTVLEQYWLYTARSPACGSVATPGSSNHESGSAVDVHEYSAARSALLAAGCTWPNYPHDPWHFNCLPRSAPRRTVLVFQRLWNLNHPDDRISEDNVWGPQTRARLRATPTAGFVYDGCSCDDTAGQFTFSCDGVNAGAHCVSINEPGDPDGWANDYLCTDTDVGFQWSYSGPIDGMRCTNVTEGLQPRDRVLRVVGQLRVHPRGRTLRAAVEQLRPDRRLVVRELERAARPGHMDRQLSLFTRAPLLERGGLHVLQQRTERRDELRRSDRTG